MCYSCFEEYGSPRIVTDRTLLAADAIRAIYDSVGGGAGGNAHVVVDDWNLEDDNIRASLGFIEGDKGGDPLRHEAERTCLRLLLSMSLDERASALAIHDGYTTGAGEKGKETN